MNLLLAFTLSFLACSVYGQEEQKNCAELYLLYCGQDTSQIKEKWFDKEDDFRGLVMFVKMQNQIYGELSPTADRNSFYVTSSQGKYNDYESVYLSAFPENLTAKFYMTVQKGKKQRYAFRNFRIESELAGIFIDSLCEPYLESIESETPDSLVSKLYMHDIKKQLMEELDSTDDEDKKARIEGEIAMMNELIQFFEKEIAVVNGSEGYSFNSSELSLLDSFPKLSVEYQYKNEDAEVVILTLNFQVIKDNYELMSISVEGS